MSQKTFIRNEIIRRILHDVEWSLSVPNILIMLTVVWTHHIENIAESFVEKNMIIWLRMA